MEDMENIIIKFQEKDLIIAILLLWRTEKIWRSKFSKNIQYRLFTLNYVLKCVADIGQLS